MNVDGLVDVARECAPRARVMAELRLGRCPPGDPFTPMMPLAVGSCGTPSVHIVQPAPRPTLQPWPRQPARKLNRRATARSGITARRFEEWITKNCNFSRRHGPARIAQ